MEMAVAAPFIAMASGVAQAGAGLVQGIQGSRAAAAERQQYEEEAQLARLSGAQQELAARKNLEKAFAINESLRAARGLTMGTGTDLALRNANIAEAESEIGTIRLNTEGRVSRSTYGALGAGMRERAGLFSGFGAVASGLGTAAQGLLRYSGSAAKRTDSSGNPY